LTLADVAAGEYALRVWDAETGRLLTGPWPALGRIETSRDGSTVLTAWRREAALRDVRTGEPVVAPFAAEDFLDQASFSPGGERVLLTTRDGFAQLWDARTGQRVGARVPCSARLPASFSPDGRFLATLAEDGTARVWQTATGSAW